VTTRWGVIGESLTNLTLPRSGGQRATSVSATLGGELCEYRQREIVAPTVAVTGRR
jgi:hypothetical protein